MHPFYRLIIGMTMTVALLCGFLHNSWPDAAVSLKRLHVFLFNLCTGGALILYFTAGRGIVTNKVKAYFCLALAYSLCAASGLYLPALFISLPLVIIVESVRIKRFSFFPWDFFDPETPVGDKFCHAAVLCLSMALVTASLVMLNNGYFHVLDYEKLSLDVFFLGYSFPISLVTMSVMFSFMKPSGSGPDRFLNEMSFWLVNLGVITFFVFIIIEWFVPEIAAALVLSITVFVIFYLFIKNAPDAQQKAFLTSGMLFLVLTAFTGIFYIARYFFPSLDRYSEFALTLHAMVSLYGWNLSGLFVIIRFEDFPIRMNSILPILLHWIIVLVLAPFGRHLAVFSIMAITAYTVLLFIVFVSKGEKKQWT